MSLISNYGQTRALDCTDGEREIFNIIYDICSGAGLDVSCLDLVRKSDSYVSAVMSSSNEYGEMDVARIKFTDRAKWIRLGPNFDKTTLGAPADVRSMSETVLDAYRFNEPYL